MEKKFYQLEATIEEARENYRSVLINLLKELDSLDKFLEKLEEENENDIENVVIKAINTKIL